MDDKTALEKLETAFQQIQEVANWVRNEREDWQQCEECECSFFREPSYRDSLLDVSAVCNHCDFGGCNRCGDAEESIDSEFYSKFMQIMRRLKITYFLNDKEIIDYNDKARR